MKKQDLIERIIRMVKERSLDDNLDIGFAEISVTGGELTFPYINLGTKQCYGPDGDELTISELKDVIRHLKDNVPVIKPTISIVAAEAKLMETLDKTSMGDVIYTAANDLFQGCVNAVETGNIVRGDNLDSGEAWYDAIRDVFFQSFYDKMLEFLQHGE